MHNPPEIQASVAGVKSLVSEIPTENYFFKPLIFNNVADATGSKGSWQQRVGCPISPMEPNDAMKDSSPWCVIEDIYNGSQHAGRAFHRLDQVQSHSALSTVLRMTPNYSTQVSPETSTDHSQDLGISNSQGAGISHGTETFGDWFLAKASKVTGNLKAARSELIARSQQQESTKKSCWRSWSDVESQVSELELYSSTEPLASHSTI